MISSSDFEFFSGLIKSEAAIVLEAGKEYLVESRLLPLIEAEGLPSIGELVQKLKGGGSAILLAQVVNALTTNETYFFRDIIPFDVLKQHVIPQLLERRANEKTLTIWCAACSTGQEPLSISILLKDHFPQLDSWNVKIIASDINDQVLARAKTGEFNQLEINRGLPAPYLVKYFKKDGTTWRVAENILSRIKFCNINLIKDWPELSRCDVVFIRNVLIYFDLQTKRDILAKVRKILRPDGYLFLGGAESPFNIDEKFDRVPFAKGYCYCLKKD